VSRVELRQLEYFVAVAEHLTPPESWGQGGVLTADR
jgi:hypothetical protein